MYIIQRISLGVKIKKTDEQRFEWNPTENNNTMFFVKQRLYDSIITREASVMEREECLCGKYEQHIFILPKILK